MQIEPESWPHIRRFPLEIAPAIAQVLGPLLEEPPRPSFHLRWDEAQTQWTSEPIIPYQLPPELQETFARTGPGCIAAE